MSFRFSATTKDNVFKCSLAKTPARKSPNVTVPCSIPKGQSMLRTNKLKTSSRRDSVAGKLKPGGQSKENNCPNEYISRVSLLWNMDKQPCFKTREEQRQKHEEEQKEKKTKVLAARRRLMAKKN